jgi:hypothetical protein
VDHHGLLGSPAHAAPDEPRCRGTRQQRARGPGTQAGPRSHAIPGVSESSLQPSLQFVQRFTEGGTGRKAANVDAHRVHDDLDLTAAAASPLVVDAERDRRVLDLPTTRRCEPPDQLDSTCGDRRRHCLVRAHFHVDVLFSRRCHRTRRSLGGPPGSLARTRPAHQSPKTLGAQPEPPVPSERPWDLRPGSEGRTDVVRTVSCTHRRDMRPLLQAGADRIPATEILFCGHHYQESPAPSRARCSGL